MTIQGHNSGTLTEKQHQALWGNHISKKLAIRRRMDELKAEEKELDADAKNDGFSKKEIKDYIDCMLSDDKQKKIDDFNMLKRNRIRLGLIADDRGADLLADRVTTEQMIYAAGVEAGLCGLSPISQYDEGSSQHQMFMEGWNAGQAILRENLQSAMEAKLRERTKEAEADGDDPFPSEDEE